VPDFTSALYLGFRHASKDLPAWEQLTLGKPAALNTVPRSGQVERQLAELIGCERALLATSTLHLFWDLFTVLARRDVSIFLDAGTYPIMRWGVERAAGMGVPVRMFRAHDVADLNAALRVQASGCPVIVADGYCPACGKLTPLAQYADAADRHGGLMVIDDSQSLGIFGAPHRRSAYGVGGGGSMRHSELNGNSSVLIGASLAKAFGVPLAMLAGNAALVDDFESRSATRVHCSPPSAASVAAASRALAMNRCEGDALRFKLFRLVARFRSGLAQLGLRSTGGLFPVQTLHLPARSSAMDVYQELHRAGISTVLHRIGENGATAISFVITAGHRATEIDQALSGLAQMVAKAQPKLQERSFVTCITDRTMAHGD
jgi:8-amino-7-oxononanoate synthase